MRDPCERLRYNPSPQLRPKEVPAMIVSVDVGYGFTKAVADSGRRASFPSTVSHDYTPALSDALGGAKDGHSVRLNRQGASETHRVGGDGQRTWSINSAGRHGYDILALAAAALVGADGDIDLALGLPLGVWIEKDQRKALRDRLQGQEAWIAVDGGDARGIHIRSVRVFPQGAGAFLAALRADPTLSDRPVGLIDIGYKTTDFLLMRASKASAGLVPDETASGSLDIGAGHVFEQVRGEVSRSSGVLIPDGAIEEAIERYHGRLYLRGNKMDVAALVDAQTRALAARVSESIRRVWSERLDLLGALLLAGGGGQLLLPHLRDLHPLLRVIPDPLFANAVGYLAMMPQVAPALPVVR